MTETYLHRKRLRAETEVFLYGAGSTGAALARALEQRNVHVRAILDRAAKPGQILAGVPVAHPEKNDFDARQRDLPVVVSIFNRDVEIAAVVRYIAGLGYGNISTYLQVHADLADLLGDNFWLTHPDRIQQASGDIAAAARLFEDSASRKVFNQIIDFRKEADFAKEPYPDFESQYFPPDIQGWYDGENLRFIDCGAYTGDTLKLMQKLGIRTELVAAFEPDPTNFQHLASYTQSLCESTNCEIAIWPCGISRNSEILSFDAGKGEGSRASAAGTISVQCVSLDDAIFGLSPSMIKMDIEGSEMHALLGGRRTIERYRPRLAISVYHVAEHLWLIPLLIESFGLDYRLYLRSHGFQTFDTILYAIPS